MLRLSSAQVTRIDESINRFERNGSEGRNSFYTPHKLRVEELVEDILKVVMPPMYIVQEDGSIKVIYDT